MSFYWWRRKRESNELNYSCFANRLKIMSTLCDAKRPNTLLRIIKTIGCPWCYPCVVSLASPETYFARRGFDVSNKLTVYGAPIRKKNCSREYKRRFWLHCMLEQVHATSTLRGLAVSFDEHLYFFNILLSQFNFLSAFLN